jgi:acyl carrier protein
MLDLADYDRRFESTVRKVFSIGDDEEIERDKDIFDHYGVDSLSLIELVQTLEDVYDLGISDEDIEGWKRGFCKNQIYLCTIDAYLRKRLVAKGIEEKVGEFPTPLRL